MEENNKIGIYLALALVAVIGLVIYYSGKSAQKEENISDLLEQNNEYQEKLEEANNNIEEANSRIEDAKMHAWESYEIMGNELEGLDTVETISEP